MPSKDLGKRRDRGYRVIRLVNGDNIVAKITGSNVQKLYLERPMLIKGMMTDGGFMQIGFHHKQEIILLENWIEFSNDNIVGIPKQSILSITNPTIGIEQLYDRQKECEDTPKSVHQLDIDIDLDDKSKSIMESVQNIDINDIVSDIISDIISNAYDNVEEDDEWSDEFVDKNRDDYGNDLNDWSPYLNDYLEDESF
jgi:hypothetical protein